MVIIEPDLDHALIIETWPEADEALERARLKIEKERDIEKTNLMDFERHSSEPPDFGRQESTLTTASSPHDILVSNDPLFPHSYAHSSTLGVPNHSNDSSGYVSANSSDLSLSTAMKSVSLHAPVALHRSRSVDDSKVPIFPAETMSHSKLKAVSSVKLTKSLSYGKTKRYPIIVEDELTAPPWSVQTFIGLDGKKVTAL